jgi:hypothetical protein
MSVDVVWRESRLDNLRSSLALTNNNNNNNNNNNSSFNRHVPLGSNRRSNNNNNNNSYDSSSAEAYQRILRRERFQFDAMYIGLHADRKCYDYLRYRVRNAIENLSNITFLCTACGDASILELEPSITIALGSGGGSGIASCLLQEAFRYVHNIHHTHHNNTVESSDKYLKSSVQTSYISTKTIQENRMSYISMSTILVQGDYIVDLLSTNTTNNRSTSKHSNQQRPKIVRNKHTGEVQLTGITLLELNNALDFERIIGLLLGRRTGINETMKTFRIPIEKNTFQQLPLASYATWTTPASTALTQTLHTYGGKIFSILRLFTVILTVL